MGIIARLPDYNKDLENKGGNIIYLNDLDPVEDHELIKRLTIASFDQASYSMIATCSCGHTTLVTHPEKSIGDICDYCHTEINIQSSQKLEPIVWIRAPDGIPALLDLTFLDLLMNTFKTGGNQNKGHLIRYLLDPYDKEYNNQQVKDYLDQCGIKRGLVYFVEKLDYVTRCILNPEVIKVKPELCSQLLAFIKEYRDKLTPYAIPMLHKSFNVIEKAQLGSIVDLKSFNPYMNVVNTVSTMKKFGRNQSIARKESIMTNILIEMRAHTNSKFAADYNKKTGEFRKHLYGSRIPWTSRMVVTSIYDVHDADEMHYSWSGAIPLFEVHLTNMFLKKGYKPNVIKERILHAINNYDPEIHGMLNHIIETSPHRTLLSGKPGYMMIENRNPSLRMGSMKALLLTKVKTDPTDITTSISVMILSSSNTDFDGDEYGVCRLSTCIGYRD